MTLGQPFKVAATTVAFSGLLLASMFVSTPRGKAHDRDDDKDPRIEQGFDIAPVDLKLEGKDRDLVGLGSYLVNTGGCNDCHSGPGGPFAAGGNPYFLGQKKKIDPNIYLSGGQNFGPVGAPPSPNIIPRNLTPDKETGLPEGGNSFEKFRTILRTGKDFDHLHPNCSAKITSNCFPPDPSNPVNGDLLQIMPWPGYQSFTDHDIRAIYEYLKAIPCIRGTYPGPGGIAANIPEEPVDRCTE